MRFDFVSYNVKSVSWWTPKFFIIKVFGMIDLLRENLNQLLLLIDIFILIIYFCLLLDFKYVQECLQIFGWGQNELSINFQAYRLPYLKFSKIYIKWEHSHVPKCPLYQKCFATNKHIILLVLTDFSWSPYCLNSFSNRIK